MKFIGFRKGTFKDQNTGREVEYANIYLTEKKDNVFGEMAVAHKAALSVIDSLKDIPLGTEVSIYFDQYKRVELVQPLKPAK